ncbi:hypothetical protein [Novosphingobium sp.]|uniref:hypothetical protein n=1 Tax=Novosphingobium sp. TaxID=1874826 RepID=UPI002B46807C|nr:hypothetical protein [Novosphingobium sp.]HKR92193.1 hypothetical protein [Novosphingobium sp.]
MDSFTIFIDPDFPVEDVETIANRLTSLNCLASGFIPPPVGLLDIAALMYAERCDEIETTLIVDRNLASRMAQLAREGAPRKWDRTTEIAVKLMAFAQAMNLDIEPGLAFHELAHRDGNASAQAELSWFRAADRGAAVKWIDVALGRATKVDLGPVAEPETHDLAKPLMRWRRNYIVALKIAEPALIGGKAVNSMLALFDWMIDDFILAGPAAMYAARYFGPLANKGRMMKSMRSNDRERAIAGAKNAAWDITYVSEFCRRTRSGEESGRQYIFASGDQALIDVASIITCGPEADEDGPSLLERLCEWWPGREGRVIHDRYLACIERVGNGRNRGTDLTGDPIGEMILQGEGWLRSWPGK